jgi:hypothetical protein
LNAFDKSKSPTPAVNGTTISHSPNLLLSACTDFLLKEEYWAKNAFVLDPSEVANVTTTANINRSNT